MQVLCESALLFFVFAPLLNVGSRMWYIIVGYLLVSALLAILLWLVLIVAKRSDERNTLDLSEDESKDT